MSEYFSKEFWAQLLHNIQDWIINDLPGILIVFILLLVLLRVTNLLLKSLKNTLTLRAGKKTKTNSEEAEKRINTLTGIVQSITKILLWSVFMMIFLKKIGIDITPILASAGILGLAVGFGAQELVRDFISGFFILLENQIRTGDVAIINGTGGLVEKIELRTITLRDFAGVVHIFQNGKINTLSNMTKEWSAIVLDIGVAYKENIHQVMQLMQKVGENLKNDETLGSSMLEPIEIFGLDKFSDSALVIKARLKTKPGMQWSVGREYRKRLKEEFDSNNIEIPFPHTTVYWGEKIDPLKLNLIKN